MSIEFIEHLEVDRGESPLLVFPDRDSSSDELLKTFSDSFQIYLLKSPLPGYDDVEEYICEVISWLREKKIKRVTVLGIGFGGTLAQQFTIEIPKVVRRLILIDSYTRRPPSFVENAVDVVEHLSPFGFPIRSLSKSFDSRHFIHRIHCPTLILKSSNVNPYLQEQGELLSKKIPNAWQSVFISNKDLVSNVKTFMDAATKKPQKNLSTPNVQNGN